MKKIMVLMVGVGLFLSALSFCAEKEKKDFGLFIGADKEDMHLISDYELIVIDAAYYSKKDILDLKERNRKVYSYFNVGALEKFRPYYERFQNLSLAPYENWPDESWIDVSKKNWQDFLVEEQGKALFEKGIDGFFIDNTDVYYQFPKEEVYEGLFSMLSRLQEKYQRPLMINGGAHFVSAVLKREGSPVFISALNQEGVFTTIDFETGTFGLKKNTRIAYYKKYFDFAKRHGILIYMTEYVGKDNRDVVPKIRQYAEKEGFYYYLSPTLNLDIE